MRLIDYVLYGKDYNFNPRTHVGCDAVPGVIDARHTYFNPRIHVGCDAISFLKNKKRDISIHAPTWGATSLVRRYSLPFKHFNPRTHVGCDQQRTFTVHDQLDFNPRTHVGCDAFSRPAFSAFIISIHAPTWGATQELTGKIETESFQSTHPRGVRHEQKTAIVEMSKFQSTHPRGVRPFRVVWFGFVNDFNPRTHVGCDSLPSLPATAAGISIHAPTWGATGIQRLAGNDSSYFNPRTHVGCDMSCPIRQGFVPISIHAPTWGCDC